MLRSKLMALAIVGLMAAVATAQVAPAPPVNPNQPTYPSQPQPGMQQPGMQQPGMQQPGMQQAQTQGQGLFKNDAVGNLIRTQIARLSALSTELNLTQQQQDQLKNVFQQHKDQIVKEVENLWRHRAQLREDVFAEQPNEQKIRQDAMALGQAIGEASVFTARMKTQVAPILTQEQRTALHRYVTNTDRDMQQFFTGISGGAERSAATPGATTR